MIREDVGRLRNYIADEIGYRQFNYRHFFTQLPGECALGMYVRFAVIPPCGTQACLAGHAIILFQIPAVSADAACEFFENDWPADRELPTAVPVLQVLTAVAQRLELSVDEVWYLCMERVEHEGEPAATRLDAIARLDRLLVGEPLPELTYCTETYGIAE